MKKTHSQQDEQILTRFESEIRSQTSTSQYEESQEGQGDTKSEFQPDDEFDIQDGVGADLDRTFESEHPIREEIPEGKEDEKFDFTDIFARQQRDMQKVFIYPPYT